LSPFDPASAAFAAGRLMLQQMREYVARGQNFAFETTLSARSYARQIRRWQSRGYRVELIFLKLRSTQLALARVKARVAQGGHHVPGPVVRRRFKLGWRNFEQLYQALVDHWEVYDNSGAEPLLLQQGDNAR
jgi:predicted ABC-type ATPase